MSYWLYFHVTFVWLRVLHSNQSLRPVHEFEKLRWASLLLNGIITILFLVIAILELTVHGKMSSIAGRLGYVLYIVIATFCAGFVLHHGLQLSRQLGEFAREMGPEAAVPDLLVRPLLGSPNAHAATSIAYSVESTPNNHEAGSTPLSIAFSLRSSSSIKIVERDADLRAKEELAVKRCALLLFGSLCVEILYQLSWFDPHLAKYYYSNYLNFLAPLPRLFNAVVIMLTFRGRTDGKEKPGNPNASLFEKETRVRGQSFRARPRNMSDSNFPTSLSLS